MKKLICFTLCFFLQASTAFTAESLILATTTSTYDSGLLDVLIPVFEKADNCKVKIIAVGTGQAIRLGRDGNADVLLVHDREAEEKFVRDGFGTKRYDVMYNDFVIVGHKTDPVKIAGLADVVSAFKKIFESNSPFVSRADSSGTHKKELTIWKKALESKLPEGKWYIESGGGMQQTLRIANEKQTYCLTDRATWLAHQKEFDVLKILCEGDKLLFNPYSVIPVAPTKFSWVNYSLAKKFVEFITDDEGKTIIKEFGKDKFGQPLFHLIGI